MKQIYDILKEWKEESKADGVIQFKFDCRTGELIIYTSYPGWLIGRAGYLIDKYKEILKEQIITFNSIKIIETDCYFIR